MYDLATPCRRLEPAGDRVGFPRTPALACPPYGLLKGVASPHGSVQERPTPLPVRRPFAGACPRGLGRRPRPVLLPPQGPGAGSRVGAADGVDVPGQRARPPSPRGG